ncbi:MAG: hypothetical protein AVDCRST_MAG79-404 [uncultured Thermoleophilia bacterium]|uniref:Uncharacterized protein n=1 Tax=uncultured Thermoleophilia bacterium TaxID=1497501 RepID=A0A6J4TI44_9ACTN|nr:MAG: hypothetical protein AVDCRST_MAG79-404 [uncultured Thermoleophilia bacterium]
MPRLLLAVPEHPEVAEQQGEAGHEAHQIADDGPAVADRPSVARGRVDHADAHHALPGRLSGRTLEVAVVDERRQGAQAVRRAARVVARQRVDEDQDRDRDDQAVDEGRGEAAPEACARTGRLSHGVPFRRTDDDVSWIQPAPSDGTGPRSVAGRLGGDDLLQEALVVGGGVGRLDPGPQRLGERAGQAGARGGRQLVAAREEAAHGGQVLGGDATRVPPLDGSRTRLRDRRRDGPRRPLADDEGACRQVAEPLVARRDEDRDRPREVGARQEVDEPQDGTQGARRERHGSAVREDDPQTGAALARRPARRARLEEDVVSEEQEEQHDGQHGSAEPARRLGGPAQQEDGERQEHGDPDQEIEERGDQPRPQTR